MASIIPKRRRVDSTGAAEITGYASETLANLRWKGAGPPYYELGEGRRKKIVYDVDELERWLAARRVVPEREPVSA